MVCPCCCPCEYCNEPIEVSFNRHGEGTVPSKYNCYCNWFEHWLLLRTIKVLKEAVEAENKNVRE